VEDYLNLGAECRLSFGKDISSQCDNDFILLLQ